MLILRPASAAKGDHVAVVHDVAAAAAAAAAADTSSSASADDASSETQKSTKTYPSVTAAVSELPSLLDLAVISTADTEAAGDNSGASVVIGKKDAQAHRQDDDAGSKVQGMAAVGSPRGSPPVVCRAQRKKLLILDLNGLLADINQDYRCSHLAHGKVRGKLGEISARLKVMMLYILGRIYIANMSHLTCCVCARGDSIQEALLRRVSGVLHPQL
jgi:hypothetical protein